MGSLGRERNSRLESSIMEDASKILNESDIQNRGEVKSNMAKCSSIDMG